MSTGDEQRGASLRNLRLVPARKLPTLPPKGERGAGLLRPATFVALGVAAVLVAIVWIGVATARTGVPTTLEGVTAEVTDEAATLLALLPGEVTTVSDESVVQECPDGSTEKQYALVRTVDASGVASASDWLQEVRAAYEERGWRVTAEQSGGERVRLSLVGTNLVPLVATVRPFDGGLRIGLSSESRCTGAQP